MPRPCSASFSPASKAKSSNAFPPRPRSREMLHAFIANAPWWLADGGLEFELVRRRLHYDDLGRSKVRAEASEEVRLPATNPGSGPPQEMRQVAYLGRLAWTQEPGSASIAPAAWEKPSARLERCASRPLPSLIFATARLAGVRGRARDSLARPDP